MLDVDEVFTVEQLLQDYCIYYPSPIDYDMLRPFLVPYDELPEYIRCHVKREVYDGDDDA